MPSTMIHITIARKYNENAGSAFFIGNIGPDAVYTREEKDRNHFRDKKDRFSALCDFAKELNTKHEYNKGFLLHLYADYHWDTTALGEFIKTVKEGHWFHPYRNEIALAGGWLYHHSEWSSKLWDDMASCQTSEYTDGYDADIENIQGYVCRNRIWHMENDIGPSLFYTPEYIEEFSEKVTSEFDNWLDEIKSK